MVNIVKNFLIMLNNLLQMHLKLSNSQRAIKKAAQATGDFISNKIAQGNYKKLLKETYIKLLKIKQIYSKKIINTQELHHRMIQRQLKMIQKMLDLIKKYLKKDIYLQNEDRKLFMNLD